MNTLHQAYSEIGDYFTGWSLPQAVLKIKAAVRATGSEEMYKGRSPAELVHFINKTKDLISAVFQLVEDKTTVGAAKLTKEQAALSCWLTEYELYCGWHKDDTPWDFFPRHLTQKEFTDPSKALKKVTRYMPEEEWRKVLNDLLQYSLSDTPFYEFNPEMKLVEISNMLYKLIEATHLIEVRAIKEDEHGPRPKWKNEKPGNNSSKKEKEKVDDETWAWAVIKGFFDFWDEDGLREDMWNMTKVALTNEEDETTAHDRSTMIFLFEQLTKLTEAVFVLHEMKEKKK